MNPFAAIKSKSEVWILNHTPACVEMSRLASLSLEQPLKFRMRLEIRLHFVVCVWCRRYFDQIHFLHKHAPRLEVRLAELPGRGLSPAAKSRIKAEVRKNMTPSV